MCILLTINSFFHRVFWTNSYTKNTNLSDVPVDPITKLAYAYSVTNTKQEYQFWAILEWESATINSQTYAWNQVATAFVRWDYNGKIIKVRKDATDYILWVPSIITSDITDVNLENILTNQKLVYKWFNNLPASFSWSIYDTSPANWFSFEPNQVILFEWNISDLESDLNKRTTFLNKLQVNYGWTEIAAESSISEILSIDLNSNSVNDFVEAAPLKETVPSSENKTTVISFYVSDQLLADFLELVEENKIVKSKVIRAAEELYFNSKFDSTHSTRSSLEKRKNKLTCAFVKSELVKRAENKGFKKTTDYLNEVLIKKMNKVF